MKRWLWLVLKILGAIVGVLAALVAAIIIILRPIGDTDPASLFAPGRPRSTVACPALLVVRPANTS